MRLVLRYWYVGYSSRLVHHSCSSLDLYQNPPLLGKGRSELNYLYPFSPPFCFIVYVVLDTDTPRFRNSSYGDSGGTNCPFKDH